MNLRRLPRRRSVVQLPPKCLGFIFFDFFSNVGGTGCRRGRTPERPLRQPPKGLVAKVWSARPFVVPTVLWISSEHSATTAFAVLGRPTRAGSLAQRLASRL